MGDNNNLATILNVVKILIAAIGLGICIWIWVSPNPESLEDVEYQQETFDAQKADLGTAVGTGLIYAEIVLGITAVLALVIFPLIYYAGHPKQLVKFAIGIGIIAAICLISWLFASDELVYGMSEGEMSLLADAATSKFVGGGITASIVLMVVTFLAFIVTEVRTALKL